MSGMSHRRRSLLFAPASDPKKLAKAAQSATDAVIVELEDGVAPNRKAEARVNAIEALRTLDFGGRERMVRVNASATSFHADDVREVLAARPDTLVLPKADSAGEIRNLVMRMEAADPDNTIKLIAMIESPRAVMNLREICDAGGSRLSGLVFGAEDFASLTGAMRTREAWEVFYARSAVVTACAAYGLDAIDLVCNDIENHERLKDECRLGRQLGYIGKQAIHPQQLDVINKFFAPTPEEIDRARQIVAAAAVHQAEGAGAFALDGQMIDAPIVQQAKRVLSGDR